MSDEENRFVRSQGGHSANELHNHGGHDDAREDKTEREDLEEEIEALDADESRVEVKVGKKIDVFDDDVELPVDPADIEPEVDPEDPIEEKKIAEAKKEEEAKAEEAIEEAIEEDAEAEAEPEAEPINDWKKKEENQAYMQIDEVKEPKAKTGAGWKVATILFALLAIAGCGAAAYLFLFDGTTKFLGREVTSKVEGAKAPTAPTTPDKPADTPIATQTAGRYIYLDGYNTAIKVPDTLKYMSYYYTQFGAKDDGNSCLAINAVTSRAQSVPNVVYYDKDFNVPTLGLLCIEDKENTTQASAPDFIFKNDAGKYFYYYAPQNFDNGLKTDSAILDESIHLIESWLKDKNNYVEIK